MKQNILNILKGKFLVSRDAIRNWRFILFASVLAVIMIASAHRVDRKVYEIDKLNSQVMKLRSEFVDVRAIVQQMRLESKVTEKVKENGLGPSALPPKKIKVAHQNNY